MVGRFLGQLTRWGSSGRELARVLPPQEYPIIDITIGSSALPHAVPGHAHPADSVDPVLAAQRRRHVGARRARAPHVDFRGIADAHGRLMVLMTHNTDIADAWEREGEDPRFFYQFSPNGYAVGINVVLYAMTH